MNDIYSRRMLKRLLEDDEIDPAEAAFMEGYNEDWRISNIRHHILYARE